MKRIGTIGAVLAFLVSSLLFTGRAQAADNGAGDAPVAVLRIEVDALSVLPSLEEGRLPRRVLPEGGPAAEKDPQGHGRGEDPVRGEGFAAVVGALQIGLEVPDDGVAVADALFG